jgi:hypothetical protein
LNVRNAIDQGELGMGRFIANGILLDVFTRVHESKSEDGQITFMHGWDVDYFPHSEVKKPSLINSCTKLLS